jgi:lipopolysaccharide transport system permease protein
MTEDTRIMDRQPTGGGDAEWTARITPHRGYFDWRLGQLMRYRDLIGMFVWRDFVSAYKQTILGPAWHLIQPLLTTLTFTIIFSRVARLSTDGAPPFLFYLLGIVTWTYFANNLTKISNTFIANAHLLGKVYFHRMVIPVSVAISNAITFAIQLAIVGVCLLWQLFTGGGVHLTSWIILTPLFFIMLAGYGLGGGIIVSALTTRYRDLANLVAFGVNLGMYATPVIYPVSAIPERYQWIAKANPLTPVIEGFRLAFLGTGSVDLAHLAVSFGVMLAVLAIGLMLFTHVERTFMDTI